MRLKRAIAFLALAQVLTGCDYNEIKRDRERLLKDNAELSRQLAKADVDQRELNRQLAQMQQERERLVIPVSSLKVSVGIGVSGIDGAGLPTRIPRLSPIGELSGSATPIRMFGRGLQPPILSQDGTGNGVLTLDFYPENPDQLGKIDVKSLQQFGSFRLRVGPLLSRVGLQAIDGGSAQVSMVVNGIRFSAPATVQLTQDADGWHRIEIAPLTGNLTAIYLGYMQRVGS